MMEDVFFKKKSYFTKLQEFLKGVDKYWDKGDTG